MKTEKEMMLETGKRIRKYRKLSSYSQEKLAEKVDVSTTTISRLEHGDQMVKVSTLMRIADVLGVTADALLYSPEPEQAETDEWDERIIILLERYSSKQKEYIWKVMKAFWDLESEDKHK